MLQIRSVVYISICFFLVQGCIRKNQVLGEYGDDLDPIEEDDETTPHNEEQTEAFTEPTQEPTPQETDQQPDNTNTPEPAAETGPDLTGPQQTPTNTADETQDEPVTTRRPFSGLSDGVGGQWSTSRYNYTTKEEKKLTPDLVEKFTMPLLENRWKWDHRREALVKNFWFTSFNEKGKRQPYRTLPTTVLIPLTNEEEQELVKPLVKSGWIKSRPANTLKRDFEFADFRLAFSFMTQVALISERIGHFPDWYNFDNWVKITLSSKSVKNLTRKDIAIAQFASRVYDRMTGREPNIVEKYA